MGQGFVPSVKLVKKPAAPLKFKNLQERIAQSKTRLLNIREKFLKLKQIYKNNKNQKDNISNL